MRIVAAREVDVPVIDALVAEAFAPFVARTGVRPAPLDTDWATVISAGGARLAAEDDRVTGVLVDRPHPGHLLLELLAVRPDAQGSGVGSALLADAERRAHRAGLPAVRLYTNAAMTENLAWYPRHGYAETVRRTEHGFDRVFFEKRLG